MIGVAASGSAVVKLNICAQQHIVVVFLNVWCCTLYIFYCINSSIATKVDSTYLGY